MTDQPVVPHCPLCGTAGQACGDDHMTDAPITSDLIKGAPMTTPEQAQPGPTKLSEYDYYVGHVKLTAQLTEAQAEAMGAVPAGTDIDAPEQGKVANREQERGNSQMAEPDANGTTGGDNEAINKARQTRNRRSS